MSQSALTLNAPIVSRPHQFNDAFGPNRTEAAIVEQHLRQLADDMRATSSYLSVAAQNPTLTNATPAAILKRLAEFNDRLNAFRVELRPIAIKATRQS